MREKPTYDDVCKTMMKDCRELLIPVINEAHGEHFTGEEKILFGNREHMIHKPDGIEKRSS
ncbi:MAG: hypothetical protein IJZ84_06130, partial [Lachnospiraceae bacterium]|nr:hypothetical protein [Lachnospiraceae bacterium]